MAIEDFIQQATDEIEAQKPLNKDINGVVSELTDEEYAEKINNLAAILNDEAQNGYKTDRQSAYASIQDQLDMMYWDGVNGTTTWKDHIAQVKSDNPKPS
jgi:hypothetical protein